jgi:hypothetical protein
MLPFFNDIVRQSVQHHAFGGQVAKYVQEARENRRLHHAILRNHLHELRHRERQHGDPQRGTDRAQAKVIPPRRNTRGVGPAAGSKTWDSAKRRSPGQRRPLDLDALRETLKGDGPAIVSIMWANNETA